MDNKGGRFLADPKYFHLSSQIIPFSFQYSILKRIRKQLSIQPSFKKAGLFPTYNYSFIRITF